MGLFILMFKAQLVELPEHLHSPQAAPLPKDHKRTAEENLDYYTQHMNAL